MRSYRLGLLLALGVAVASAAMCAGAAVFNVDTVIDDPSLIACDDATPNDCSLRGAIIKANGLSEPVTINLPAGTYVLSQATPCFFRGIGIGALFTTPGLCPVGTVTLVGQGADMTIIDANQPPGNTFAFAPVMFVATTANVAVRGVTMRRGNFTSGTLVGNGGGINNAGVLTLVDCVVSDNQTIVGGGIFNQNDLTLLHTVVTRNTARDGGGIWNTARFDRCTDVSCPGGIVTIADSTISDNVAAGGGGGIVNFVGTIDVVGSAVVRNLATGNGGGIVNSSSETMNLTNVTVSGNRAFNCGGICNNFAATMHLNNVTVTGNTAQSATDPSSGSGGGLLNSDLGVMTLANTIVAGNFAAGSCGINGCFPAGSDCVAFAGHGGSLTSLGYNLIQDTQACDIEGNTTGNITGQDPKLGVLADNGGWTVTHAPGTSSPALDAGNPAPPGSGGAACAALDQRGFPRPLGAGCDIGALERTGAFGMFRILPNTGGNGGEVTALVSGNGFVDGSSVKLSRAGAPDIVASPVQVDNGGSAIAATFDLMGAPAGAWNVVVTKPDSSSQTLAGGFTVQEGGGPDLWIAVTGHVLPRHGTSQLTIFYGNRGIVDALAVPLQISSSSQYGLSTLFDIAQPPAQADQVLTGYTQVPAIVQAGTGGYTNLPLLLPVVPAGFSGMLQILFTLPPVPTTPGTLFANIDTPYYNPTLGPEIVDRLVQGAIAYAPLGFHVDINPALAPTLAQYVRNQLQLVVERGRNAFVTSLGTAPHVYSQGQLAVDAAFVGARRTLRP